MNTPSFLFQSRHGIWKFRYIFSRPWRQRLGQTEIRRSLATRDRTQAIRQARQLAVILETRLLSPYDSPMEYKEIRTLVDQYLDAGKPAVNEKFQIEGPLSSKDRQTVQANIKADRTSVHLDI